MGRWTHKTHKGGFVKVHYPWHPLFGCEVQVLNVSHRGGDSFYCVRPADASLLLVPVWMTDEAECRRFVKRETPQVSVAALKQLRQLIDAVAPRADG
jgi:hypothetical protein